MIRAAAVHGRAYEYVCDNLNDQTDQNESEVRPMIRVLRMLACLLLLLAKTTSVSAQPQEAVEYYATDALGSIRVVFNDQGTVIGRGDYLPYGEEGPTSTGLPTERFTGEARDAEAGMDYFGARMYQPRTGRFSTADPVFGSALMQPQRWNRYAYALSSPLVMTDSSGLDPIYYTEGTCSGTFGSACNDNGGGPGLFWWWGGWINPGDIFSGYYEDYQWAQQSLNQANYDLWLASLNAPATPAAPTTPVEEAADGLDMPQCPGCLPYEGDPDPYLSTDDFVSNLANSAPLMAGSIFKAGWSSIANTFAGRIRSVVLQSDVTAFRYWGGQSQQVGRWLTTRQTVGQIASPADAVRLLNLPAANTAENLSTFTIPKGTEIFIGRVAGGGAKATQIYVPNPSVLVAK
jgi:RHS repeat-associated protein